MHLFVAREGKILHFYKQILKLTLERSSLNNFYPISERTFFATVPKLSSDEDLIQTDIQPNWKKHS